MRYEIRAATADDLQAVVDVYGDLNDYLKANNITYLGWKRGFYPTDREAENGLAEGSLYVAVDTDADTNSKAGGRIAGSIILNHDHYCDEFPAFRDANWVVKEGDLSKVAVMQTLAVHPDYWSKGAGRALVDFVEKLAKSRGLRSIRLGVTEGNIPASKLYEKCGYQYVGKADLGYRDIGIPWFSLYELPLD